MNLDGAVPAAIGLALWLLWVMFCVRYNQGWIMLSVGSVICGYGIWRCLKTGGSV